MPIFWRIVTFLLYSVRIIPVSYTHLDVYKRQRQMLPYIDVLIDGKFIQEQADPSLVWRGSANQVIYRFKV